MPSHVSNMTLQLTYFLSSLFHPLRLYALPCVGQEAVSMYVIIYFFYFHNVYHSFQLEVIGHLEALECTSYSFFLRNLVLLHILLYFWSILFEYLLSEIILNFGTKKDLSLQMPFWRF